MKTTLSVIALLLLIACKPYNKRIAATNHTSATWGILADSLQDKLQEAFLAANEKYYAQDNKGNKQFHYWRNAHAMEVLADAYERTNDKKYLRRIKRLHQGLYETNKNSFINDFYDDMAWLGIAELRAYKCSKDKAYMQTAKIIWQDILTGINDNDGRSLSWSKPTPAFKNTPANGPAIIMGLRLYKLTREGSYRDTAVMLYHWLAQTLINTDNLSWDGIKNGHLEKAIYTYNQGLFIGASLEMFYLTGEQQYLAKAFNTARSAMLNEKISPGGVLKPEGQGDGGLFKGIFIRYFTALLKEKALRNEERALLLRYLVKNAETLYTQGLDRHLLLINYDWNKKPTGTIDLSTQLSGMMLAEAMASLSKETHLLIPGK